VGTVIRDAGFTTDVLFRIILEHCWEELFVVLRNKSDYGWVMLSYQLQLLWLLVYTFNNRNIPWL
jgi:hypothetical protein